MVDGGSQETAVVMPPWRRSCRWPRSYAQISSTRMTLQKLSFRKTTRCLLEYSLCRAKVAC